MLVLSSFRHALVLPPFLCTAGAVLALLLASACGGVLYPVDDSSDDEAPSIGGSDETAAAGAAPIDHDDLGSVPQDLPESAADCPSYDDDFRPSVHDPICSHCHGTANGLPAFSSHAEAQALCSTIGEEVSQGTMPPSNSRLELSPHQYALTLRWVELGCPETRSQATSRCALLDATPTTGGGDTSLVVISRADFDPDKQELHIRGEVSDPNVALTAEFGDRSEPLVNDEGRFRQDFSGVETHPGIVHVIASDGGSATLVVEAD